MSNGLSDVFSIDQNYPTSNALLVPGPNPDFYTVYIYKYSDWVVGNKKTSFAITQSGVNTNGTWKGTFDSISQTYSPVSLPETELDGSPATPYTIVAINPTTTIILALQVIAPIPVPPSLIGGPGIVITGDWPDQTVSVVGGGAGVLSLNSLTGALSITPGLTIDVDVSGSDIEVGVDPEGIALLIEYFS